MRHRMMGVATKSAVSEDTTRAGLETWARGKGERILVEGHFGELSRDVKGRSDHATTGDPKEKIQKTEPRTEITEIQSLCGKFT